MFRFSLNTIVRYPHSYEKLNQIKFKPTENILFTTGADFCLKSWILTENNQPGIKHVAIKYGNFKGFNLNFY